MSDLNNTDLTDKQGKGRPTLYKPEYCQQIIDYFNIEPYIERVEITTFKDGSTKEHIILIPNDLPTFEGFARKIDVSIDTIQEWKKKYSDFSLSTSRCKGLQKNILIINSLKGLYQSNYAIFVTSNLTKFRQKKDITANVKKSVKFENIDFSQLNEEEAKKRLEKLNNELH